MPAQTLYRKWRSQRFDQVLGQEHVTQTLLHALEGERVAHAYLFTGPRGTGKTSTARILAKAVNCLRNGHGEPCNECEICRSINEGRALDLIEIDAASNRGIDEIRDLREKVAFSPTQARYKVYIVDEVHMLTNEAFNALLKTLEEPPPHVIFVLATTEPHRLPATILSRCQRFDFHRASLRQIQSKLTTICQEEGIHIEPAALDLIARSATGSFRDAESLLDQLAAYGDSEITLAYVRAILGASSTQAVGELAGHLIGHQVAEGLKLIDRVASDGVDLRQFNRDLVDYLRGLLLIKAGTPQLLPVTAETLEEMQAQAKALSLGELVRLAKLFSQAGLALRTSPQPQLALELAFLEAASNLSPHPSPAMGGEGGGVGAAAPRPTPPTSEVRPNRPLPGAGVTGPPRPGYTAGSSGTRPLPARPATPASTTTAEPVVAASVATVPLEQGTAGEGLERVVAAWPQVLAGVRDVSRSVEAFLKACAPRAVLDDTVVLGFYYPFHKESVENPKNKIVVEDVLSKVLGQRLRIRCALAPRAQAKPATSPTTSSIGAGPDTSSAARSIEVSPTTSPPTSSGAGAGGQSTPRERKEAVAEDLLIKEAMRIFNANIADVQPLPAPPRDGGHGEPAQSGLDAEDSEV
jgi:DNA polymerase-3 subunit gamma/tau